MITIERKKLEQVLEALTYCEALNKDVEQQKMQAITAIKETLAQPEQEPVAWKPDRSGKYLTVVYRDVIPGDEVGAIVDHPKCVIMSWSNAVHDVEQLKNPPQRPWVGLTDEQFLEAARLAEGGNYLVSFQRIQQWLREGNT